MHHAPWPIGSATSICYLPRRLMRPVSATVVLTTFAHHLAQPARQDPL